ncbi:kinase-like domain-containing protein [Rhizophagus clarus]|uniref:Kinase-like domain-containing protein n=1 Tax=Rhizophagus clarus TaxID=94130 RepID=A0A8H3LNR3_9GLOM|nr:kinase-like domain-containing protein [Rhizophagus clarus]
MANSHKNIIQFHGITKFNDEEKISLILQYAEDRTLKDYLRNDTITFEWKNQLKFAKEIASAILWLHDDKRIVHGDLHHDNILVHQIGRFWPLAVLFWELTSRSSPFNYENKDCISLMFSILNGSRENPVPNTNVKFIELYRKCWEHEPDKRPDIRRVNLELSDIDSENIKTSAVFYSNEREINEEIESEYYDLSNVEKDCDINAIMNS